MNEGTRDLFAAMNIVAKFIDTETPILSRRLPVPRKGGEGRQTKLPQNVWFQSVFLHNELNNLQGQYDKVLTDQQILYNWNEEFGKGVRNTNVNVGNAIKSGKHSIGHFRSKYRKATLYNQQIKHFLISLKYDNNGCPVRDARKKFYYLDLETIRALCMDLKIGDPRFFTSTELDTIRQVAKKRNEINLWGLPSPTQFQELESAIPGGIYGRYILYEDFKAKQVYKRRTRVQQMRDPKPPGTQ